MKTQIEKLIVWLAFRMDADKAFEQKIKIAVWAIIALAIMLIGYKLFQLTLWLMLYRPYLLGCILLVFTASFSAWLIFTEEK